MTKSTEHASTSNMSFRSYAYTGYVGIALVFGCLGGWAAIAPLDSAAVAPAKVAVETERKPVQHLEGGIVREILVKESARVEQGQVLFRLQPTQAQGNMDLLHKQSDALMATEARLLAELDTKSEIARLDVVETANAVADQRRQFTERRQSVDNQTGILRARIEQTTRDIEGRRHHLTALKSQLASLTSELNKIASLAERGLYPRNKLLALQRDQTRLAGEVGTTGSDMEKLDESIKEARIQITQIDQKRREEITEQLGTTRAKLSDLNEKLMIAQDVLQRIEVRAPRKGIAMGIKAHTIGAVVAPGSTLAEIVPVEDMLVLSAKVSLLDIQSVANGQKAEVRFPAFSTRQLPPVFGRVVSIAADAIQDETTKEFYYATHVTLTPAEIPEEISSKLMPGMPADVLIITGERTVLAYLVGPLRDRIAKAMRDI
jgi:HlyD family secretion protein